MTSSRLKDLRKAAALSQEQLARDSDISIQTIQKYEQGLYAIEGARYPTLLRISNALGVPFWELFDDRDAAEAAICNTCCRSCALREIRKSS